MTLLIRNVRILGGARKFPEKSDIFVQNEVISAIGNLPNKKADVMLDGQGLFLAPGFIDINTDSDHYLTLFDNPAQQDFLKQGVTTIIGGMCGSSLAPLLYGSLESVAKWQNVNCINVGWHSMQEFLQILEKRGLGVNFGTLVGHATIRRALTGETFRNLTKNEIRVFKVTLAKALYEGGFGFSTGLAYVHARETSYAELRTLLQTVKERNSIYATHLRNTKEELSKSVEETLKLRKESGVQTLISHFLPFEGTEKEYTTILEKLEKLTDDRAIYFDVYPFDHSIIPIYTLLPKWAQKTNVATMLSILQDTWKRKRILAELPEFSGDELVIAIAQENETLVGKNIDAIKELYGVSSGKEALLKLMRATSLRAVVFYRNITTDLLPYAVSHSRSLIATNAASIKKNQHIMLKPERAVQTFPKFLDMVSEKKLMSLEDAVRKITKIPATLLGLSRRGEIKEGNFADLVTFSWKEGEREATEIRIVVVNGTVAVQNREEKGTLKGRILRSNHE